MCEEECGFGEGGGRREIKSPNKSALPSRRSAAVCGAAGRQECFSGPHCLGPMAQPQLQPDVVPGPTKRSTLKESGVDVYWSLDTLETKASREVAVTVSGARAFQGVPSPSWGRIS